MDDRKTAIQARGLSKTLGGRTVLRQLDLDVAEGEQIALTGSNGAGKTTLLRCLASVLRPSSGEVRWFGQPAAGDPAARRLIAMVGHETRLYPHLTVRENLVFAGRMCDVRRPQRRTDQLLQSIGLRWCAHRFPARISKGMRQRVAIVRALIHDPRILLLDEPFSGLDGEATGWLLALLRDLRARGNTVCFTTHDRQRAEHLGDRVLELRCGRAEEVRVAGRTVSGNASPKARAA
ncbi:MAG: heme ABC exporter ATP-binding protein CcmA [Planctomycetota bacterium]|jgi:heme ABC exporter ATP-binding subunit CcmA